MIYKIVVDFAQWEERAKKDRREREAAPKGMYNKPT